MGSDNLGGGSLNDGDMLLRLFDSGGSIPGIQTNGFPAAFQLEAIMIISAGILLVNRTEFKSKAFTGHGVPLNKLPQIKIN